MRKSFLGVSVLALASGVVSATACGIGDEPLARWSLDRPEYHGEGGLPFLSPSNDSRLNLRLLMRDAEPRQPAAAAPTGDLGAPPLFSIRDLDPGAPPRADYESVSFGKTQFMDGEGTRCVSDASGQKAFAEAVKADAGVAGAERDRLIAARTAMAALCAADGAAKDDDGVAALAQDASLSSAARDFAAYLSGAKGFYAGEFDPALAQFDNLGKSQNAWLRETALYMKARTLLNKAQVGAFAALDGGAQPKVIDTAALTASDAAFRAYLAAYGNGRYAASARGLLRRLYWLAGDQAKLSAEYGWRLQHPGDPQANLDDNSLAQEIDAKSLTVGAPTHDPALLAVNDLMRLRKEEPSNFFYWGTAAPAKPVLTEAELAAQQPDFAGREALFAYLRAARVWYGEGDAHKTLDLLGPAPSAAENVAPMSTLAFSREALRGQALMALQQWPAAIDHWTKLLSPASAPFQREAVELGLAMSWERAATVNKVFAPDSPITSPRIRAILLRFAAGPILLREAVANPRLTPAERGLAQFTLLYKEATRGQNVNFLKDFVPAIENVKYTPFLRTPSDVSFNWQGQAEPYACPPLKATIAALQANPNASNGKLCVAEFIRASSLDDFERDAPAANELGGAKSIYPGAPYARGEIYRQLIDSAATPDADRAYALFRAINCYGPSGNNGCGGKGVDKAQRKAWFQSLKSDYPASPWAQKLKYYW